MEIEGFVKEPSSLATCVGLVEDLKTGWDKLGLIYHIISQPYICYASQVNFDFLQPGKVWSFVS